MRFSRYKSDCFFRALKTLEKAIHRINLVKRSLAAPGNLRFLFSVVSKKSLLRLLFRYSQTPLSDTLSIRTSHHYEQFPLSWGENALIFSLNQEEKSLRHVAMVAKFLDDNKPKIHLKSKFALFQTSSIFV